MQVGIPADYWRDYLLLTQLHLTPAAAAECSAVELDYLLEMHAAVMEAQNHGD